VLVDRFRLVSQLGAGGMGSVWLARDLNLETDVAIKLIDPTLLDSPEAIGRFRQEAQSAAMIRSSHVVQILDYGVDQGRPYMAMELLSGEDLGTRLERVGCLTPERTGTILWQVARAVSLAHSRGIVHRDLKPENVFLIHESDDEIAKVLDFGIARRFNALADSALSQTRTGTMLGTPYYMSPEQATGQPVDHLTDIWAFGVTAFECLAGRRAFDGESIGALFHAICMLKVPIPSELAVVPTGFDEWFARCVERDRTKRFSSIREAAERLCHVCGVRIASGGTLDRSSSRTSSVRYESLTATAVSAISTELDQTTPPSANTLMGRARKRPIMLFGAIAAISVLIVATIWRSSEGRIARVSHSPALSDAPASPAPPAAFQPAALPPSMASVSAPTVTVADAAVETVVSGNSSARTKPQTTKPKATKPSTSVPMQSNTKKIELKRDDNAAGI